MKTIKIFGASDDLVYVDGLVPGADEYSVGRGDVSHVIVRSEPSREDVFRVSYGKRKGATWLVEHVTQSGALSVEVASCDHESDDPDPYTDTATVTGRITLVECWGSWPPTHAEIRDKWEGLTDSLDDREVEACLRLVLGLRAEGGGA